MIILKILAFLTLWTVAGFILGPPIGRFLKWNRREQMIRDYPLPPSSILGNRPERELSR